MDWIAACFTILGIELLRRKMWQGFLVGLLNEISWAYIAINSKLYGLLLLCAVLGVQYTHGVITWRRAAK